MKKHNQLKYEMDSFFRGSQDEMTGWGTYYGPMIVMGNGDGTATESPSIRRVTDKIIEYWIDRADKTKHPVFRTRYADLVWDFSKEIIGSPANYKVAHIIIDSTISIAEQDLHINKVSMKTKLKRALDLSLSLNYKARVTKVANTIIDYEDKISQDEKIGLWGFSRYSIVFLHYLKLLLKLISGCFLHSGILTLRSAVIPDAPCTGLTE